MLTLFVSTLTGGAFAFYWSWSRATGLATTARKVRADRDQATAKAATLAQAEAIKDASAVTLGYIFSIRFWSAARLAGGGALLGATIGLVTMLAFGR